MRTLWLSFNGTSEAEAYFELPMLNYPLCYNIPSISWAEEQDQIRLNPQIETFAIHLDIMVEVDSVVSKKAVSDSDIRGYRPCIGIADTGMLEKNRPEWSTARDVVVNHYYSRFYEASNIVGPHLPVKDYDELIEQLIQFTCNSEEMELPLNLRFSSYDVLTFLADFTTLNPGDMVSLGSVWIGNFQQRQNVQCKLELLGQSFAVRISN